MKRLQPMVWVPAALTWQTGLVRRCAREGCGAGGTGSWCSLLPCAWGTCGGAGRLWRVMGGASSGRSEGDAVSTFMLAHAGDAGMVLLESRAAELVGCRSCSKVPSAGFASCCCLRASLSMDHL